jgi:hypothetical protein
MSLCYDFQKWTIISFASVAITLTIGLLLINFAHGQNQTNDSKTYASNENDLNFTIQYPADWKVKTLGGFISDDISGISFKANRERDNGLGALDDGSLKVIISNVKSYLDTNTMTLKNRTLIEKVNEFKDGMQYGTDLLYNAELIRENKTAVAGNDAIKMEYKMEEKSNNNEHYGFWILTIANGKEYVLAYQDEPLKVPETLPLVNKMVESFKVGAVK